MKRRTVRGHPEFDFEKAIESRGEPPRSTPFPMKIGDDWNCLYHRYSTCDRQLRESHRKSWVALMIAWNRQPFSPDLVNRDLHTYPY